MTQLALFAEPVKPSAPPVLADSRWTYRWTKPGQAIRELRVKSCDGQSAVVCPTNFVDEAWPWTGRMLTVAQLRKDWIQVQRRSPHAKRNP